MKPYGVTAAALALLLGASPAPVAIETVRGRCAGCRPNCQLGRFQFVDAVEGWAVGHAPQANTILHTRDRGGSWKPVESILISRLAVESATDFVNPRRGWIWWAEAGGQGHLLRTEDQGRTWRDLEARIEGELVHLQFFDPRAGIGVVATNGGARVVRTADGGVTWSETPVDCGRPSVFYFSDRQNCWVGGAINDAPHIFLTTDGGESWRAGIVPENVRGTPHDLYFRDAKAGWLALGNTVLETADGGETWRVSSIGAQLVPNESVSAIRFPSEREGYVFLNAALLVTKDGGDTWKRVAPAPPVQSCNVVGREVWCSSGMNIIKVRPAH